MSDTDPKRCERPTSTQVCIFLCPAGRVAHRSRVGEAVARQGLQGVFVAGVIQEIVMALEVVVFHLMMSPIQQAVYDVVNRRAAVLSERVTNLAICL